MNTSASSPDVASLFGRRLSCTPTSSTTTTSKPRHQQQPKQRKWLVGYLGNQPPCPACTCVVNNSGWLSKYLLFRSPTLSLVYRSSIRVCYSSAVDVLGFKREPNFFATSYRLLYTRDSGLFTHITFYNSIL